MSAVRIERIALVLTSLLVGISILWMSPPVSISLLGGSAIAMVSFALLRLCLVGAITSGGTARIFLIVAAGLKLLVVGVVLWLIIAHLSVRAIPFLIGLSVIVAAIVIEALYVQLTESE